MWWQDAVSLFPNFSKENSIGVMIVFGKDEHEKVEKQSRFSDYVLTTYNNAKTYRDRKRVIFEAPSNEPSDDVLSLLSIKRKPNKK